MKKSHKYSHPALKTIWKVCAKFHNHTITRFVWVTNLFAFIQRQSLTLRKNFTPKLDPNYTNHTKFFHTSRRSINCKESVLNSLKCLSEKTWILSIVLRKLSYKIPLSPSNHRSKLIKLHKDLCHCDQHHIETCCKISSLQYYWKYLTCFIVRNYVQVYLHHFY